MTQESLGAIEADAAEEQDEKWQPFDRFVQCFPERRVLHLMPQHAESHHVDAAEHHDQ